jgi:hypothetical protein
MILMESALINDKILILNDKISILNDNILQIEEYNHLISSLNDINNDTINDKILKINNKINNI